jgi:hypothetical protein
MMAKHPHFGRFNESVKLEKGEREKLSFWLQKSKISKKLIQKFQV